MIEEMKIGYVYQTKYKDNYDGIIYCYDVVGNNYVCSFIQMNTFADGWEDSLNTPSHYSKNCLRNKEYEFNEIGMHNDGDIYPEYLL